jgi:hypothetical protein
VWGGGRRLAQNGVPGMLLRNFDILVSIVMYMGERVVGGWRPKAAGPKKSSGDDFRDFLVVSVLQCYGFIELLSKVLVSTAIGL